MICPNKICQKEIPNDSVFCDQCGVHLRQCTKCGSITLAKFCTECGGVVIDRKITEDTNLEQIGSKSETIDFVQNEIKEQQSGGTVIVESIPELKIIHPNFTITPESGDVLGRTTGPHATRLGQFPVISSKHGKVELLGNEWFFTDLHSSNKSYLNGSVISSEVPTKLTDGDNLVLANISFSVSIK